MGILREGTATFAYYGVADVRTGAPVTAETRFSPGSLTKSMVATVIAGLAAADRLSLNDLCNYARVAGPAARGDAGARGISSHCL